MTDSKFDSSQFSYRIVYVSTDSLYAGAQSFTPCILRDAVSVSTTFVRSCVRAYMEVRARVCGLCCVLVEPRSHTSNPAASSHDLAAATPPKVAALAGKARNKAGLKPLINPAGPSVASICLTHAATDVY